MSTLKHIPLILLAFLLAACSATPTAETATPPDLAAATATTFQPEPTATTEPLAFTVNGEGFSLEAFNAELERYRQSQAALGLEVNDETARQVVLDDLIAQVLLAQSARQSGFSLEESGLQQRIDDLTAQLGGADALSAWQQAHGYDESSFRVALKRSAESAWMRDQILSSFSSTVEQVHIRQILTYNQEDAQAALSRLNSGSDFDELAALYDPATRGDIGWFPRGYLDLPEVEAAAFSLQVDEISPIIESEIGFHIIKVIERDPARPLSFEALLSLQASTLEDWVATRRAESEIVVITQE